MLALSAGTKVYFACKPVSMHKGFDGLAALTRELFAADPFQGICSCRWPVVSLLMHVGGRETRHGALGGEIAFELAEDRKDA